MLQSCFVETMRASVVLLFAFLGLAFVAAYAAVEVSININNFCSCCFSRLRSCVLSECKHNVGLHCSIKANEDRHTVILLRKHRRGGEPQLTVFGFCSLTLGYLTMILIAGFLCFLIDRQIIEEFRF